MAAIKTHNFNKRRCIHKRAVRTVVKQIAEKFQAREWIDKTDGEVHT